LYAFPRPAEHKIHDDEKFVLDPLMREKIRPDVGRPTAPLAVIRLPCIRTEDDPSSCRWTGQRVRRRQG
jgi:hypothetical protein